MKIKVLKGFRDIRTNAQYEPGKVLDVTEGRFKEMVKNLEKFGGGYVEVIPDPPQEEPSPQADIPTPKPKKKT